VAAVGVAEGTSARAKTKSGFPVDIFSAKENQTVAKLFAIWPNEGTVPLDVVLSYVQELHSDFRPWARTKNSVRTALCPFPGATTRAKNQPGRFFAGTRGHRSQKKA